MRMVRYLDSENSETIWIFPAKKSKLRNDSEKKRNITYYLDLTFSKSSNLFSSLGRCVNFKSAPSFRRNVF